jgi:hypothetical protein
LRAHQIYDSVIFELAICAFDTRSGWRHAFERQREYPRSDLFIGKLNPENFSQILQEMKRYLDYIPMEQNTGKYKIPIVMAYGKALLDYEFRSITWRAIPPDQTVHLLALGKEPWKFRDLNDQFDAYRQQWKSDQQKQIMINIAGKLPGKSSDGKRTHNARNTHNSGGGRSGRRQ